MAHLREQQLRPKPPGLEQMLADRRQAHVVGDLDVVVPDDREILGDAQAGLASGRDRAQGLDVGRREYGRRPVG